VTGIDGGLPQAYRIRQRTNRTEKARYGFIEFLIKSKKIVHDKSKITR